VASGEGFNVDPQQLKDFSTFLSTSTQPAVQSAADRMKAANGFDNEAFGIFLAQIWAIPSRITMAAIQGEISKLVGDIGNSATDVKKAAEAYETQVADAAKSLGTFKAELGK
jgi:hypothetical protein